MCNMNFKYNETLNWHRRVHHSDHDLQCNFCDEKFTSVEQLKKHKLSHSGENPYNCKICKSTFSELSKWRIHECITAKQSEELIDDCFKVEIKEEIPLDIYDEID